MSDRDSGLCELMCMGWLIDDVCVMMGDMMSNRVDGLHLSRGGWVQ